MPGAVAGRSRGTDMGSAGVPAPALRQEGVLSACCRAQASWKIPEVLQILITMSLTENLLQERTSLALFGKATNLLKACTGGRRLVVLCGDGCHTLTGSASCHRGPLPRRSRSSLCMTLLPSCQ